ncbi:MAG: ectonucleotide pyrophosphatase/phosphodiesterase [Bacillota bacterium]|nr:ectonucleotide pyrophosphatase/phosphodiesterase [Bacillota bacterium]
MEKKRMLVISIDAMVFEDLEYFKTLPNFKEYSNGSSLVQRMLTVYPSLTYPAHVSIITGTYPDKHGVTHNEIYKIYEGPTIWEWYGKAIKVPTLFELAKKKGYTTANVNWPVTAGLDIDYSIPEIWPLYEKEDPRPLFEKVGSAPIIDTIFEKNRKYWDWKNHPGYEVFATACAVDIIKTYKPEFMAIHLAETDHERHANGVFSNYLRKAIDLTDQQLGDIFNALKEAGVYEDTNIIILGDHGQMDVHKVSCLNVLFEKEGLIKLNSDGHIESYDAYCRSAGLSAHIMLSDPDNKQLSDKVYSLLKEWQKEPSYGIGEIYTKEEAKEKFHLEGPFSFVLETDGCTSFGASVHEPIVRAVRNEDYKFSRATHGYNPAKGPQPPFIVKGPDFANNVEIERASTVDEAPTIAKVLGIEIPDPDGKILTELLK